MTYLDLCIRIRTAGGKPYYIGGCVRDHILDRVPHDIDICVVGMTMTRLLATFPEGKPVGKDFPIIIVDNIEIALARAERKIGVGHASFECDTVGVTLQQDLFRRDLTINAMAMDPFTGDIIDPYGGRQAIIEKRLLPVSEYFIEDPLRVLRAARFAAQLDFNISWELVNMCQALRLQVASLSGERIFGELMKALQGDRPSRFFKMLDLFECLDKVFPEVANLMGRIQPEKYHPEGECFEHFLQVLDCARRLNADDETMFAALCHDFGKAATPDDDLPRHINHEALGIPIVKKFCERLKVPNNFKQIALLVTKEHLNIHRFQDLRPITQVRLITRLNGIHDEHTLKKICIACMADAQGRGPAYWEKDYPQLDTILKTANIIRSVRGDQFSHIKDGNIIAQKLEQERAKAIVKAGL